MLAEALRDQILPRIENKSAPLVPAHPLAKVPGIRITAHTAPLLSAIRGGKRYTKAAHWVEERLNSAGFPILIWVMEGEADFRIGVTRRMAAQNKNLSSQHGYYVTMLPPGSLFVVPGGVPISDASRPHWERGNLQDAHSSLLWFHLVPAGVSVHACTTRGHEHTPTRGLFLGEPRLLSLVEAALEELQTRTPQSLDLARHYLLAMLLHVERVLEGPRVPVEEELLTPPAHDILKSASTPVERACRYMEIHFSQRITLEQLSAHVHVSPAHLCRLFRSELQQTPGEFLAQRRLQQARSLLVTTDLPVRRIGVICGYPSPEHFNRSFRQSAGVTPGQFRRQPR